MLKLYEKQRGKALNLLGYALFAFWLCLIAIQPSRAADAVCNPVYSGTTQATLSTALPLCSVGTISDFQNSGGSGPWVWKCLGTDWGGDIYCSAYKTGALPLSVSCFPAKINTNTSSDVTCAEEHGYSVLWSPAWFPVYLSGACATTSTNFSADYSDLNFLWLNCPNSIATFPVSVYSGNAPQDIFNFSVVTTAINGECNPNYDGENLANAPEEGTLCTNGKESALEGDGPWVWYCEGSNGGTTAYCSANTAPTVTTLSISCSPNSLNTNTATSIVCQEAQGDFVVWSSVWIDDCTYEDVADLSNLIGASIASTNFSCRTARTVTVTAKAGSQTATTTIEVTDAVIPTEEDPLTIISCTPANVMAGGTVSCTANKSATWTFPGTLASCSPSSSLTTVLCDIPSTYTAGAVTVNAVNGAETAYAQFMVTVPDPQQIIVTCSPAAVGQWATVTCFAKAENKAVNVDWTFTGGASLPGCNIPGVSSVPCSIPLTYPSGPVVVTATDPTWKYTSGASPFVVTDKTLTDLAITCDDENLTGKAFSCAATCGGKPESVSWMPSQCIAGPLTSTSCTFANSGTQTITATPILGSNCRATNTNVRIEQAEPAKVTCTGPFRIDEPFACTVTCEEEAVSANWSIASSGTSSCTPSVGTSTQCRTSTVATVTASGAGHCSSSSSAISLTYYDLVLSCTPTTVHSGGNETFTCTVSGGDQNYTWVYPSTIIADPSSTNTIKKLSVSILSGANYPSDGKITIKVQDGHNTSKEASINLLPPGIYVEDIYKMGNAGIEIGATEDLYLQLNAVGGVEDIHTIQAKLIKGACANSTECAGKQVFNVVSESPKLQETKSTGSGANTLYNLLYKLPVLIPDYEDLTNGDYTYIVTVYDVFNQQTVAYLSSYIGTPVDADLNWDQSIDILDVIKTVMYYLNPSLTPTAFERDAIDFNNNQQIDLTDVIKVIQEAMKE